MPEGPVSGPVAVAHNYGDMVSRGLDLLGKKYLISNLLGLSKRHTTSIRYAFEMGGLGVFCRLTR